MNKLHNPKRQAILDAATRAFIAHGYSGASMEAIAEAAPVSKPTLYNHFKSKQDLFAAVIEGRCEALLSTLDSVQTGFDDPVAGLSAIAGAFIDLVYADEALQLYRLIIAEQQHFPDLGERIYRSGPEPVLRQMASYLAELNARGILTIPDLETSGRLFLDMLKGDQHFRCLLGLQSGLSETEKQRLIVAVVSFFLKGHGYEA
ncbi:MAG: TetR/AcrR family transcriptional regulator [Methylobacter sp.]|jgi:TetR/AcrR family transcriptional repressor of mexJK operon|uniref:TetR/AcrR family transcriptional regulator n=1 Tax=Methylobacter sp. TaxID=2051955 RepID=UPI0025DED1B9|nr:TetR/AcrR family transcriptional regulator [Methylobacter sp.]MCK9619403.1 TetR/AcrR family transcriptional regulator [Methylobacter sp.]